MPENVAALAALDAVVDEAFNFPLGERLRFGFRPDRLWEGCLVNFDQRGWICIEPAPSTTETKERPQSSQNHFPALDF